MKFFLTVGFLFLTQVIFAQLHQDVFPDETGDVLLNHLESAYKPAFVLSYGDARRKMFGVVDNVNDSVHCVYSDDVIYINPLKDPKDDAYSKGFNTEHTFPQSKGATGDAKSNVHHLFPTRIDVNGARGHLPFDEIVDTQTDSWFYKAQVLHSIPNFNIDEWSELDENIDFEPREAHKGNVARAMMYFYTMYHDQADAADFGYFQAMLPTLCAWHYEDEVDQREWDRTWAIASFQDDKPNPFVLDCTLPERSYCAGMDYTCVVGTGEALRVIRLYRSYPNPASTWLKIRFTLQYGSAGGQLVITDITGRVVALRPMKNLQAGPNEMLFDVSDWKPGTYLYFITVHGERVAGKFVVM